MIGENGTPVTPDWTIANVGNVCTNCLGTANLCNCLRAVDTKPCCGRCSHVVEIEPLTWAGDQA